MSTTAVESGRPRVQVRAIDLAVLTGLVCLSALLLAPVYGGAAPLQVMAAGAVVAAVILWGVSAVRWPSWVAVPLIAMATVGLGSSMVGGGLNLPTVAAMKGVITGSVTGWRDMLTVAVPIGTTGSLLVPPLLMGAVAVTAAGLIAGTRRYPAALVPVALCWFGAALLGQAQTSDVNVGVLGAVAVIAGLGWVSWRRGRGVRVLGPRGTRWRRPVFATVLLAVVGLLAATVAVAAPASGSRLALRADLAAPVDPRSFVSPLSGFRADVKDDASTVEFTATGVVAGDRLRLAALDSYDGQVFTATPAEGPFARIGETSAAAIPGADRSVGIQIDNYQGPYAPTLGELTSISFGGSRSAALTDGFRYAGDASTGLLAAGWTKGDSYQESAVVPPTPSSQDLGQSRIATVPWPQTPPIPDSLRAAAAKYTNGIAAPAAQLAALAKGLAADGYFSHGLAGQLRSPSGHGLDRLLDMVSGTGMVGDQEQYAALMAVLARSLGIPARVVVGYVVPTGTSGSVQIHGADLSAWVEAPFQGYGWVAFDPTPSADRTHLDTVPKAQAGRHVTDNEPPPAAAGADSATVQSGDSQKQQDKPAAGAQPQVPVHSGWPWWLWAALAVLALILVLMLPVLAMLGWKRWRRARRRRSGSPESRVRAAWRSVLDSALDAGFRPDRSHTRQETAEQLFAATAVETSAIAAAADAAEFAPALTAPETADRQWAAADESGKQLLARLGPRARWRAKVSPASLRTK